MDNVTHLSAVTLAAAAAEEHAFSSTLQEATEFKLSVNANTNLRYLN